MIRTVDVSEAQKNFETLLDLARAGNEVLITEHDSPVARLMPMATEGKRVAGLNRGQIWIGADFDEPLPADLNDCPSGDGP